MKKEKIIIVSSIILIFLLCIGAISAADSDNVTSNSIDIVSSNNATDESPLTEDNSNTLSDLNNKITNDIEVDTFGGAATLQVWASVWILRAECVPLPLVYQCGHGARLDTGYRYSSAFLQLWR